MSINQDKAWRQKAFWKHQCPKNKKRDALYNQAALCMQAIYIILCTRALK